MGLLDHVKIENLDEDQRKMVELVCLDGFKSLVRAFGGTTIYIPKAESLEHRDLSYLGNVSLSLKDQVRLKIEEMEEKEIREEFDGGNYRELAAKYGLTERWVRFILFGKLDNLDDDMEGQMSIYDYPEAF